jgi:anti-sigma factor RsiW
MSTRLKTAELSCQEMVELVTDFLEGKLDPDQRALFEQHLLWCPACNVYLVQIREQVAATGRLTEEKVEPEARDALLHAFRSWKTRGGSP